MDSNSILKEQIDSFQSFLFISFAFIITLKVNTKLLSVHDNYMYNNNHYYIDWITKTTKIMEILFGTYY